PLELLPGVEQLGQVGGRALERHPLSLRRCSGRRSTDTSRPSCQSSDISLSFGKCRTLTSRLLLPLLLVAPPRADGTTRSTTCSTSTRQNGSRHSVTRCAATSATSCSSVRCRSPRSPSASADPAGPSPTTSTSCSTPVCSRSPTPAGYAPWTNASTVAPHA